MFGVGPQEFILISFFSIILVVPFWKIFTKAGYPGFLCFTLFVPVLNVVVLFWFAFAEWPIHRRAD